MAAVTVPSEFFRAELRVYGDWRGALARELLQNATDAAPSRIDVRFEDIDGPNGRHGRVTFSDDGHGMTREVLEEVFFALGKTTKTSADSIGGFGRARIIICFAQLRYQIRTGNLLVEGAGGEYTIREVSEHCKGCEFVIDLIDETSENVRWAFDRLLRSSSIRVPITVDGERVTGQQMPSRATRILRDGNGAPWARAYVTSGYGDMFVRVHGLQMFTRYTGTDDKVIVELEPSRSREVLSASRDTLHTVFGDQVDQFVADLSRNRRVALRPAVTPLDLRVGGGGFLATDAEPDQVGNTDTAPDDSLDSSGSTVTRPAGQDGGGRQIPIRPANAAAYTNMASRTEGAIPDGMLDLELNEPDRTPLGFDVYLMADRSDAKIRRLARAWDPSSWDANTGRRRRALLLTWKAAVGYMLDQLVKEVHDLERVVWTVGWTFDDDVNAVHRSTGSGHILALNPVTESGAGKYHVSDRRDRQKLVAIAAHEVAHVVADSHDERFASVLTRLFAALDPKVVDRLMRDAYAAA